MKREAVLQLFFGCDEKDVSEFVVFTPLPPSNLDDFRALCDEVRNEFSGWVGSGFSGLAEDFPVTVICPGTGSSQIGDATLAVGYGPCRVAIFVGSVGGLGDGMDIGDIVVVEEAVIGEGFSRYHTSEGLSQDTFGRIAQADEALLGFVWPRLRSRAQDYGLITHKGRVFTTESLLAETEQFLKGIVGRGCIGIEKEASAFYTAARKANIKAAAVLCISDLPLHRKSLFAVRKEEEEGKRVKVRHEMIPRIVLDLALGCYRTGWTT